MLTVDTYFFLGTVWILLGVQLRALFFSLKPLATVESIKQYMGVNMTSFQNHWRECDSPNEQRTLHLALSIPTFSYL